MDTYTHALRSRRVLLADDLDFVRQGTVPILEQAGLVVDTCRSGAHLRDALTTATAAYDAVILDIHGMGDATTFVPERDIPRLLQDFPAVVFIVFSVETVLARQYLALGVHGYVVKDDEAWRLLVALERALLEGEIYCSPTVRAGDLWDLLTLREREILALTADGHTNKEIAYRFQVPDHVVERHCRCIRGKLAAINMTHAVALALRQGLLD